MKVIDSENDRFHDEVDIVINVLNENDNFPIFTEVDIFEIAEDVSVGQYIGSVFAHDLDLGPYGEILYEIDSDVLAIDAFNGSLFTTQSLDREKRASHLMAITATDSDGLRTTISVSLIVLDVNDNPPMFTQTKIMAYAIEGEAGFDNLVEIRITDADGPGANSNITLIPTKYNSVLKIIEKSSNNWVVNSTAGFDLDSYSSCSGELVLYDTILLIASDGGNPVLSTEFDFEIYVTDRNNHTPKIINPNTALLMEMSPVGTFVANVDVTDGDPCNPNNIASLSVVGEYADYFRVLKGELIVANSAIDYERLGANITITLKAADRGVPTLESHATMIILIDDINDEPPTIVNWNLTNSVVENISLGEVVAYFTIADPDLNAILSYDLKCECRKFFTKKDCNKLSIEPVGESQSWSLSVVVADVINFEEESEFTCVVQITDEKAELEFGDQTVQKAFVIQVIDVNDNVPIFSNESFLFHVPENVLPGQFIGTVYAVDADFQDQIIYSISVNDHISIEPDSGELKIKQTFDYERGFHSQLKQ